MKDDIASLVYELFCDWGTVHRLSNSDMVLQPQQLADVLACVFTKLEKSKDLKEGLLIHNDEILGSIWQAYDSRLWSMTSSMSSSVRRDPPFIDLLHSCGLAYKLRDDKGSWLQVSLIPALLPSVPSGFNPTATINEDALKQLFFAGLDNVKIHHTLVVSFTPMIPIPFLSQVQVQLQYTAAHNRS